MSTTLSETARDVLARCPCPVPIGPEDMPCGASVAVTLREFDEALVGMRIAPKCNAGHALTDEDQLDVADQVRRGECDVSSADAKAIRLMGCDEPATETKDPNDALALAMRLSTALIDMQTALRALQGRVDDLTASAQGGKP